MATSKSVHMIIQPTSTRFLFTSNSLTFLSDTLSNPPHVMTTSKPYDSLNSSSPPVVTCHSVISRHLACTLQTLHILHIHLVSMLHLHTAMDLHTTSSVLSSSIDLFSLSLCNPQEKNPHIIIITFIHKNKVMVCVKKVYQTIKYNAHKVTHWCVSTVEQQLNIKDWTGIFEL